MKYIRPGLFLLYIAILRLKFWYLTKTASQETIDAFADGCAKKWSLVMNESFKVKSNIDGLENLPEGNCLFVANHQGLFDIVEMLAMIPKPMGFVAKIEYEHTPIISYWMKNIHCVFLDRENPREAIKTFNKASEYLKAGYSITLFAGGTRTRESTVGEFKKGSLKIASKTPHIPIVPVAIEGTYKAFEEKNSFRSAKVKMKVGKAIYQDTLSKEDKKDLSAYCENIVKELYSDLTK